MKVSLNWLKELVDFNLTPKDLADKLSLASIGVKEVTDDFIELDLTYNRGDLLSMRGVAKEVAAITNSQLQFKDLNEKELIWNQSKLPTTPISVEKEELAQLQCVAKIEGLTVGPSSPEVIKKLADCGVRSVNNIVDVTNLMMLLFGQPFHSFDASTIKDETINVRLAKDEEEITTLDGKLRKLTANDIVLADTQRAVDVAGVMGGKDTETSDSTNTILLTASLFNPLMVRQTSMRLKLASEASKRFQHGLTKTNLLQALSAAIKMYEQMGGKLTALTIVGNTKDEVRTVTLTQEKINSLIGIDIPREQVEKSLQSLGFHLKREGANVSHLEGGLAWHVQPPYWRLDIEIEEDLIEEVARMYGYEKIPSQELRGKSPEKIDQTLPNLIYDLKKALADLGLTEIQTYSFYSSQVLNNLEWNKENLVKIANPISSETKYLRDTLWPNLLEVTAKNLKNGFKDAAIFEIGKIYSPQKGDLPKENYRLAIALANGTDNPIQELNQIFKSLHLRLSGGKLMQEKYFHPKRFSSTLAEIHPRFVNRFGIEKRVAVLEVDLEPLS